MGYRHIDTAGIYGNLSGFVSWNEAYSALFDSSGTEKAVGEAVRESGRAHRLMLLRL